jgi:hypothetical protein
LWNGNCRLPLVMYHSSRPVPVIGCWLGREDKTWNIGTINLFALPCFVFSLPPFSTPGIKKVFCINYRKKAPAAMTVSAVYQRLWKRVVRLQLTSIIILHGWEKVSLSHVYRTAEKSECGDAAWWLVHDLLPISGSLIHLQPQDTPKGVKSSSHNWISTQIYIQGDSVIPPTCGIFAMCTLVSESRDWL